MSLNFSVMRKNMIQGQILPVQALSTPLHQAAETLPREMNLPEALAPLAYSDQELIIADNRFMLSPAAFFKLVSAAQITPQDRVLDVGCATGYTTATLSYPAKHVVGIEASESLSEQAGIFIEKRNISNVDIVTAPLFSGCLDKGPYDVIVIEGAVNTPPSTLSNQLKEGGRLVFFRQVKPGELSTGVCARRKGGVLFEESLFHWQASPLETEL